MGNVLYVSQYLRETNCTNLFCLYIVYKPLVKWSWKKRHKIPETTLPYSVPAWLNFLDCNMNVDFTKNLKLPIKDLAISYWFAMKI